MKVALVLLSLLLVTVAQGQQEAKQDSPAEHHCPMMTQDSKMKHDSSMKHDSTMKDDDTAKHEEMMRRGEMEMGFSQTKTSHHFQLSSSGGSIDVRTNDPSDAATRAHIRHHLQQIAKSFAEGDFSSPMLTHGQIPPGVREMQRLKSALSYKYVETDRGGKVLISADSPEALKAVQEFLQFQIEEHQTGDSEAVQK